MIQKFDIKFKDGAGNVHEEQARGNVVEAAIKVVLWGASRKYARPISILSVRCAA